MTESDTSREKTRYNDDLALAHVLADAADNVSWARFGAQDLHVSTKPDATPVTDADTAVETTIRGILSRARPRDAVIGEEYGGVESMAEHTGRVWVIDPIDGTKNFLRGVPIWATLIALLDRGRPMLGLVSAPGLSRRWWGAVGSGAFVGRHAGKGTRIRVSNVTTLSDASLCYASPHSWSDVGRGAEFSRLTKRVWRERGYGDFYGHVLVAEGAVDAMIEPELSLWDGAALIPIVSEAGGRCTDLDNEAFRHGSSLITTNGRLHDAVTQALAVSSDSG
jgi:histidinol-phosphatase